MDGDSEVIAVLLGEPGGNAGRGESARGAQLLVRDAAGRVSLEAVASQEQFDRTARSSGCFRRGKAIYDPSTREVIGYEMEEVPLAAATA